MLVKLRNIVLISLFLFPVLFCFSIHASADDYRLFSIGENLADDEWRNNTMPVVIRSYEELQRLDPNSQRNVATFRLVSEIGDQSTSIDFHNVLFVSGGNVMVTQQLAEAINEGADEVFTSQCIAQYLPPVPSKPRDFALRREIVEFFEFREALTERRKNEIAGAFIDCINPEYFTDVILTESAKSKLHLSLLDSLCFRQFDEHSNEKGRTLGLIDKTRKNSTYVHIDNLFGKNFQLNFADSEQTIRMFIGQNGQREAFDISAFAKLDPLATLLALEDECTIIRQRYTLHKTLDEEVKALMLPNLQKREIELIAIINSWIDQNLKCCLEIASSYDMCDNCKATFRYDFAEKYQISRIVLFMFINGIKTQSKDLGWCLMGWVHKRGVTNQELNLPQMSLKVSSFIEY